MEKQPRYLPGQVLTGFPTADVAAGTLCMIDGEPTAQGDYKIKPCTEGGKALGQVVRDVDVSELADTAVDKRTAVVTGGAVVRLKAGAKVEAGKEVYCSGSGLIKNLAEGKTACGLCLKGAANEAYAEVLLYLPG